MDALVQDLRFGFRTWIRKPGFTLAVVLSLALAIGPNTVIFSLINSAFLKPLGVEDSDSLVAVLGTDAQYPGYVPHSYPNFEDLRDRNDVLSGLLAVQTAGFAMATPRGPDFVLGGFVSGDYFDVLGVRAAAGRTFQADDYAHEGAGAVAVLSHRTWQRRFGADPNVVGTSIVLNNHSFTIIGVAAEGFDGLDKTALSELWVPVTMFPQISRFGPFFREREWRIFELFGRLKPGVGLRQAEAELRILAAELRAEHPDVNKTAEVELATATSTMLGANDQSSYAQRGTLLMLAVSLLLLIACANVANLLLAHSAGRRREVALRLSIGAGRGRLIRQLLTESLLLALAGGALGLILAAVSRGFIQGLRPDLGPRQTALSLDVDLRVLGFVLLVSVLASVLFGLAPALRSSRTDLVSSLKEGVKTTAGGTTHWYGARNLLVVVQVALSAVALISAGLLVRSLRNYQQIDPGYDADKLLVMSFSLLEQGYDEPRARNFMRRGIEVVESVPGVVSASLAVNRPFNTGGQYQELYAQGASPDQALSSRIEIVTTEFFATVGIPILQGRAFSAVDHADAQQVAIVNETLARSLWPGQDPLGRQLRFVSGGDPIEVVGVARDARYVRIDEAPQPYLYRPAEQVYPRRLTLYVRAENDPQALLGTVRRELQALDETLPLVDARTVPAILREAFWGPRMGAVMTSSFGLLALILVATGVYGTMAYTVVQRRHEISIRMAMGADKANVALAILKQALLIVAIGLTLGLLLALAGQRVIGSTLYGLSATDPAAFALAVVFLVLSGLAASLIPAWRASRLAPAALLRHS